MGLHIYYPFNRTMLELKSCVGVYKLTTIKAFNRTMLELK